MICRLLSALSGTDENRIRGALWQACDDLADFGKLIGIDLFLIGLLGLIAWGSMMPNG